MEPAIFDTSSPWSNLWIISSALYALVWIVAIATALAAAAAVPYLTARLVVGRKRARTATAHRRTLISATVALIILMAVVVVALAYTAGSTRTKGSTEHRIPLSSQEIIPKSNVPP